MEPIIRPYSQTLLQQPENINGKESNGGIFRTLLFDSFFMDNIRDKKEFGGVKLAKMNAAKAFLAFLTDIVWCLQQLGIILENNLHLKSN